MVQQPATSELTFETQVNFFKTSSKTMIPQTQTQQPGVAQPVMVQQPMVQQPVYAQQPMYAAPQPQQVVVVNQEKEKYCGPMSWLVCLVFGFPCIAMCPLDEH